MFWRTYSSIIRGITVNAVPYLNTALCYASILLQLVDSADLKMHELAPVFEGSGARLLGELSAPCPRREELCGDTPSEVDCEFFDSFSYKA